MTAPGEFARAIWVEPPSGPSWRPQRMRREFDLEDAPGAATVRVTARGVYALFLNDERVDSAALCPAPRGDGLLSYQTYDVTRYLRTGTNVIGLIVGAGWNAQKPPPMALLLQLDVTGADGRVTHVGSDEHFSCTVGAIIHSRPGHGERQEHQLREAGWKLPLFDESAWGRVSASANQSRADLVAQRGRPVEIVAVVPAAAVLATPSGERLVDFGRIIVGRVVVTFDLPTGHEVRLEHILDLDPAGDVSELAEHPTDEFMSAGTPREVFEPGFSLHTFRYVRVTGLTRLNRSDFSAHEISLGSRSSPPRGRQRGAE